MALRDGMRIKTRVNDGWLLATEQMGRRWKMNEKVKNECIGCEVEGEKSQAN
jgi:hypothetical protein